MIIVNVNKTSPGHVVRESAAAEWLIAEWRLKKYGDRLVAVERNVVVGVFVIDGWSRVAGPKSGVVFELREDDGALGIEVGDPSPDPWLAGQRWPVKYLATETWLAGREAKTLAPMDLVGVPGVRIALGDGEVRIEVDLDLYGHAISVTGSKIALELTPNFEHALYAETGARL